jgi:hypothetical protein
VKKPDFFIIGAPKCGTTALSEYLRTHPQVFFSNPKELYFFDKDLHPKNTLSEDEYIRRYFSGAGDKHLAVGEGSPLYLWSKMALSLICRFNPSAKFIVMLRDPVSLAYAWHAEKLASAVENITDFETAWRVQDPRLKGHSLPRSVRGHEMHLQYRYVAQLGEQVQRLLGLVSWEKVLFLIYDDLKADPAGVYKKVLVFLDLKPDGRDHFPVVNPAREHRFEVLRKLDMFLKAPPDSLDRIKCWFKGVLSVKSLGIHKLVNRLNAHVNVVYKPRPPLRPEFEQELRDYFREDIALLANLMKHDLSPWQRGCPLPVAQNEGESYI